MNLNWNFLGGEGVQNKKLSMKIFWKVLHILTLIFLILMLEVTRSRGSREEGD